MNLSLSIAYFKHLPSVAVQRFTPMRLLQEIGTCKKSQDTFVTFQQITFVEMFHSSEITVNSGGKLFFFFARDRAIQATIEHHSAIQILATFSTHSSIQTMTFSTVENILDFFYYGKFKICLKRYKKQFFFTL